MTTPAPSVLNEVEVFRQNARTARGTPPQHNAAEAIGLCELLAGWDETVERVDVGLASLTAKELDSPAPGSPRNNPNETIRSLFVLVTFHQAYHAGQTGILRRITGKGGAIS